MALQKGDILIAKQELEMLSGSNEGKKALIIGKEYPIDAVLFNDEAENENELHQIKIHSEVDSDHYFIINESLYNIFKLKEK